jgi:ribose transport system substrate-binding protein
VLQQHPDLCATYGFWGIMQQGSAQAVKNAGLQNKVKVYASSDGPRSDCNLVEQGLFHKILSFRADIQGEQIANAVLMLLQSNNPPGSHHFSLISNSFWISSADDRDYCFDLPETP